MPKQKQKLGNNGEPEIAPDDTPEFEELRERGGNITQEIERENKEQTDDSQDKPITEYPRNEDDQLNKELHEGKETTSEQGEIINNNYAFLNHLKKYQKDFIFYRIEIEDKENQFKEISTGINIEQISPKITDSLFKKITSSRYIYKNLIDGSIYLLRRFKWTPNEAQQEQMKAFNREIAKIPSFKLA
jgi:signal recognition particle GTPase